MVSGGTYGTEQIIATSGYGRGILILLFLPASGAFYAVGTLPVALQGIVTWIPTVNGTELLRAGMFGPGYEAHYDLGYFAALNLALMIPGLLLVRHVQVTAEGE